MRNQPSERNQTVVRVKRVMRQNQFRIVRAREFIVFILVQNRYWGLEKQRLGREVGEGFKGGV